MMVGKTGHGPSCKQDEINALMVALAQGRQARGAAEGRRSDDLRPRRRGDRGLPRRRTFRSRSCPASPPRRARPRACCVSLTHREQARRLQYVTGHARDGRLPADIDWRALADPAATTVVYMPKRTLRELTARAIAAGLDPATPAVAVANATRPDETIIAGTIAEHRGTGRSGRAGRPGAGDDRESAGGGRRESGLGKPQ